MASKEHHEQQVQRGALVHHRVWLVQFIDHKIEEIHGLALRCVPTLTELLLQHLHNVLASLHAFVESCARNGNWK